MILISRRLEACVNWLRGNIPGVRLGMFALGDGVVELEDFLDEVGADRLAGLDAVPGAAPAQVPDHVDSASKR